MAEAAATAERLRPGGGEAVVSFTTKLPDQYQVPEDQLVLPSTLARYGLSEVVNKMLDLAKPVPFDFLVNGEFLRTSIAQYLEARKLSSEKVLRLEYVIALSEPEQSQVDQIPDWIAGIVPLQRFPASRFAAVSYDGTVRVYEDTRSCLISKLADCPLTGVAGMPVAGGAHVVAAGKDGTIRCCALQAKGEAKLAAGPVASMRAPSLSQAMQAVAFSEDGTLLAGAGWDHEVLVWNAEQALFASDDSGGAGSKRKSVTSEGVAPKFALKGHTQVVTALHFGAQAQFPFTVLSSSWDCSVRVWDTAAASCVCNWSVARAATGFSIAPKAPPQMATSHEDGHVSIWDIRAAPHSSIQGAVALDMSAGLSLASSQVPHRRLCSQVAWCPEDVNRIASVGHDGRLNLLDPRSPKMPLQALRIGKTGACPTKLLCMAWLGRDDLVVGGSDGRVIRVSTASAATVAA